LLARSTPAESLSTLTASSASCCSTVAILVVTVGGFDFPRWLGVVVELVVDLGSRPNSFKGWRVPHRMMQRADVRCLCVVATT
jgi:hypothetical protein